MKMLLEVSAQKIGYYYILSLGACLVLVGILSYRQGQGSTEKGHHWLLYRLFRVRGSDNTKMEDTLMYDMIEDMQDIVINYENFTFTKPNFVTDYDEQLFYMNAKNLADLQPRKEELLTGVITVLRNGTLHENYDCGWNSNLTQFVVPYSGRIRQHFQIICPLLIPDGSSFQHFLDGVLPKIIQVHSILLKFPEAKIFVFRPRDRIVDEILNLLNFDKERVLFYDRGYYTSDYVINTCITPPLHPNLWKSARKFLGAPDHLLRNSSPSYVILLSRKGARNRGRHIGNKMAVIDFLSKRYPKEFKYFTGKTSLLQAKDLFGKARIVIGIHGGAFYNIHFCPIETHIVELMPSYPDGDIVPHTIAHTIVWQMSSIMNQTYWRLNQTPKTPFGDLEVDLEKLTLVLDKIDNTTLV